MASDDDLASPATPASTSTSVPTGTDGTTPIEGANEFSTVEVAGDPPSGETTGATAPDQEVSADGASSGELVEATESQLAAESGEESALSDLRGVEGFEEAASVGTESSVAETGLSEAGEATSAATAEFLPFLASLVPTLISTVGPVIAKGIAGGLSPRARQVINKLPAPTPGPARVPPGSTGALLAQIAQLLKTMQSRPGGESGPEAANEVLINEAVAVLEVIIGTDDRVRLQNTLDIPWRRTCALRITFPTGAVYRGTGFLIGPRALATAGHCVYLHSQGGWARSVEVIPGANGSAKPYGSVQSSQLRSVAGWVNSRRPESDYGCIVLPQSPFAGKVLGNFAVSAMTAQDLVAKPAVLAGYPGDKPFAELWGMARKIKTVTANTLIYDIDSMGGQSGSPVYIKRNGQRYVVGIHNYGAAGGNSATRVTQSVFQRLSAWSKL